MRDADQPNAPPQPSPVAENLLKERIKAFGFRTWSDDGTRPADPKQGADFAVLGEVQIKKLSTRLEASGVVVTKYTLTSWTVKCHRSRDRRGDLLQHDAAERHRQLGERRRRDEGHRREDRRRILAQLLPAVRHRDRPQGRAAHRRLPGSRPRTRCCGSSSVCRRSSRRRARANAKPRVYDLQLAGSGAEGDLVAAGVLKPLNAKLGQSCFSLGRIAGEDVEVTFAKACAEPGVLSRLETNPPAGLYGAPLPRQKALIKDPEMLRRLSI